MATKYSENGQEYKFNREYARSLVYNSVKAENEHLRQTLKRFYGSKKRYTKTDMYKMISQRCNVEPVTVKKWFLGANASDPSSVDMVHHLEAFLGELYGNTYDLLIPIKNMEGKMISMITEDEKNYARELYIRLLNTIDRAVPSFKDFLENGPQNIGGYNNSMSATRYETVMAVKATAFDLPESLRLSVIALIDDIYGPESDEPGSFFSTNDFKEFIASDEYQQYLKANCPDGVDRDVDQLNYCEAKREEFFSRLDEIFSVYIRRT